MSSQESGDWWPGTYLLPAISSHHDDVGLGNTDGLVQERHNSIANALERHNSSALAMELCLSCTKPSICGVTDKKFLQIIAWPQNKQCAIYLYNVDDPVFRLVQGIYMHH